MRSATSMEVAIYSNQTEILVRFPIKWEICPACSGEGTTSRHVECDGGGFTASEWAEQDDEFREDYMNGMYDRECCECNGLGRVQSIDFDWVTAFGGWRKNVLLRAYLKQERDSRDIDAMMAAERRMGA